ncbi:hypothetical protein LH47_01685 [Anoxybacillus thermarum]|uniref:Uncharacterized protein n=1 Tax=Anoxybacillus thermarum TaxID=404937 RepID=A0A0D0RR77_9BACL|nr:hypothetical protein LH47_01685 [Anoxybacillus thermarum]
MRNVYISIFVCLFLFAHPAWAQGETSITLSVAGDVTLGRDENYGYTYSFDYEAKKMAFLFLQNILNQFLSKMILQPSIWKQR